MIMLKDSSYQEITVSARALHHHGKVEDGLAFTANALHVF